jgi:hypothetical protein
MNLMKHRATALGACLVTIMWLGPAACDSDEDPQLLIVSPAAGSSHALGENMKVQFTISANDFEFKQSCSGEEDCGVAYLNIDGTACNAPGRQYNNILADGDFGQDFFVDALFEYCPAGQRTGTHNVTVSLRRPDGSMVIGEGGQPAAASISIVTTP